MSKVLPKILLEYKHKNFIDQLLETESLYIVLYDNCFFNLRSLKNTIDKNLYVKYKKTVFCNPGHAHRLTSKLNKIFNTDKFTVIKLAVEDCKK